jgi:gamma-glutamyltranspeptidase/glutathione hydrolase
VTSFSRSQRVTKPAVESRGGVVAAQHGRAAELGAEVLAAGGDAADAAVAVSFMLGVLEPWMSGPAGGGAAMLWREAEGRAHALNYGMRAPAGLDPAEYPLSGAGRASDLFPWEAVEGDRNAQGATAVAVPGLVDGIGLMHARFGRMPWAELVRPAAAMAREGLPLDWYAGLMIASAARALAADPDAAAMFLEDGLWPPLAGWTALTDRRLSLSSMAETLERIAEGGPRELYDGDTGAALAADVAAKGGALARDDLRAYRAEWEDPLTIRHRGGSIWATPRLTAGPTLGDVLARLRERPAPEGPPGAEDVVAWAEALSAAYARRLAVMGDEVEAAAAPACTTHFSIVDRDGNMAAVTQTLLSSFGARCVSPSTGLLLNNGIMWFDPVPGRPNSLRPGKRCLMNVCPVLGETPSGARFALGASGGRKILPAVAQLALRLIEHGESLDAAFHAPRIDVSGDLAAGATAVADAAWPAAVLDALRARFPVATAPRAPFPYAFACPAGVLRADGVNAGATEPLSPWGDAAAEPDPAPDAEPTGDPA